METARPFPHGRARRSQVEARTGRCPDLWGSKGSVFSSAGQREDARNAKGSINADETDEDDFDDAHDALLFSVFPVSPDRR
ncbi:MAG: hypothetical protein DHS20C04_14930 [Hyphococcus sp.]|nr:MAG: hypothetical protein DHS20C04_14930 [Marinicaulis sp.]